MNFDCGKQVQSGGRVYRGECSSPVLTLLISSLGYVSTTKEATAVISCSKGYGNYDTD